MINDCTIQFLFIFVGNEVVCQEFYTFPYPSLAQDETENATSRDKCKDIAEASAAAKNSSNWFYAWNAEDGICLIDNDITHKCIQDSQGFELTNSTCPFPFGAAIIGGLLLVGFLGAIVYAYRTSKTIEA